MNIRCPQCKRLFDYDPESGPARCTYQDCGWEFKRAVEQVLTDSDQAPQVTEAETSTSLDRAPKSVSIRTQGREIERRPQLAPTHTIRCPACRSIIPDDSITCPVCEVNVDEALGRQDGIRAVFDVSGDITFSPKMVVVLFISTLAAFLAFTWIISGRGQQEDVAPIELTAPQPGAAGGEHMSSLQGVDFAQLKREFLDPRLTDLRRDALKDEFSGQRVIWDGVVTSVEKTGESYRIEIAMGKPDSHGYVTLDALRHDANQKRVLELRRGDQVMFSGTIRSFFNGGPYDPLDFFRIELSNGLLLN